MANIDIKFIAKKSGCSIATVSRVINLPEANFVSISQLKCKRFPVRCNHRILPEEF